MGVELSGKIGNMRWKKQIEMQSPLTSFLQHFQGGALTIQERAPRLRQYGWSKSWTFERTANRTHSTVVTATLSLIHLRRSWQKLANVFRKQGREEGDGQIYRDFLSCESRLKYQQKNRKLHVTCFEVNIGDICNGR